MRDLEDNAPYDDPYDRREFAIPAQARPRKNVPGIVFILCMIALLLSMIGLLFYRQFTVVGDSMAPTLMAGDRVFYIGFSEAGYGELVIFDAGETYGLVVKRVVGLPGDRIAVTSDGTLIRNGAPVEEAYALYDAFGNSAMDEVTVESGKLFVLGDNRASSIDSRDVRIGQISQSAVQGVVTRMLRNTETSS